MWWALLLNSIAGLLNGGGGGGGGGASYESIATLNGTGSSGVITFSSIPSTFKSLQLRWICRTANAATSDTIFMTINGNTGANYARHNMQGNGTSVSAGNAVSGNNIILDATAGNSEASGIHSVGILDIVDYQNTTKNKTTQHIMGIDRNGGGIVFPVSGLFMNTAAVTSLTFTTNSGSAYLTSTQFSLYGIKG